MVASGWGEDVVGGVVAVFGEEALGFVGLAVGLVEAVELGRDLTFFAVGGGSGWAG